MPTATKSTHNQDHIQTIRASFMPNKSLMAPQQRKNSASSDCMSSHLQPKTKQAAELHQLKVPLTSYQVASSSTNSRSDLGNGRLGSAASRSKQSKLLPNLESLKELALQHQSDIFSLGDNKNKDHNRMVIYGVSDLKTSRSNFSSKLEEPSRMFDESCFERDFCFKESTLLTNRSRRSVTRNQSKLHDYNSLENATGRFKNLLSTHEQHRQSVTSDSARAKTAKI